MLSSWRIGRIAGIPLYVHWTFLILLAYVAYGSWQATHNVWSTIVGVLFVLALFLCVILHELGHALAARHYGIPTADITLLPIGGIARLQRIPEHPVQELVVALAGPLVNIVIAGSLFLGGVPLPAISQPHHLVYGLFLPKLLELNLFLALFNLIPAFPMDGGRVLRALLAMRFEYGQATRIAATVGQFIAIFFAAYGLWHNGLLILIALFVWIGAESEAIQVQERLALKDIKVGDAMLTDYRTLSPGDTLGQAANLLLAGSQTDFPVVRDGQGEGVLTRADLMTGLAEGGREALVADHFTSELATVEAGSPLLPAMTKLREDGVPCLQVLEGGEPVGLLTTENIGEFLMVRSALANASRTAGRNLSGSYAS